jgi:hypothetical protein
MFVVKKSKADVESMISAVLKPKRSEAFSTMMPSKSLVTKEEVADDSTVYESPNIPTRVLLEKEAQNTGLIKEMAKHLKYITRLAVHKERISKSTDKLYGEASKKAQELRKVLRDSHYLDRFTRSKIKLLE